MASRKRAAGLKVVQPSRDMPSKSTKLGRQTGNRSMATIQAVSTSLQTLIKVTGLSFTTSAGVLLQNMLKMEQLMMGMFLHVVPVLRGAHPLEPIIG